MDTTTALLAAAFFTAAILYAAVGHAGASGYLAAMALASVAPAEMKPTALALNVVVATIATVRFTRAGLFSWRLFWPFALTSVPLAFVGGMLTLPGGIYRPIVGAVLLYSAARLLWNSRSEAAAARDLGRLRLPLSLLAGAGIGLLSGLTGVGGGIFLSPLLLLTRMTDPRHASGVAAPFILVNSIAALAGHPAGLANISASFPLFVVCVAVGGWLGATHGSRRLAGPAILRVLAAVLAIAGVKMLLS